MNSNTGTVTFLFTDIEGSTKLWERYPDVMRRTLARHDALLRSAIQVHGGEVFKTIGDAFCAVFQRVPDALAAVVAAQRALSAEPWPDVTPIRVRMALHTGTAEERDGDYFGPVLNRVARLLAVGHGGQTLLSATTFELARDHLPTGVGLSDLGAHRLKDLDRPEQVYQVTHSDRTDRFPPLRSLESLPNNLPQQLTSFIGREKAMAEVRTQLLRTRLLTLTGAGGSGKTRLAFQVAADVLEDYQDGVWQVELAPLSDPAQVVTTVASALDVKEQAGETLLQSLLAHLHARQLLLLLDNCEHLVAACAQLAAALVRYCPSLKVLATSREPLGIAGELTYRVPSLSLPEPQAVRDSTPESLRQYEAVRLFIERALWVNPDFAVTNANAPTVAQLCHRLDGIPLAIELASARVRSLSVEDINARLDGRFRLLTGGDRSALPRQQTLRALVDWSYDLLKDQEKTLLARLSVFAGGWTLEAAEAVCGFDPVANGEVLDLLTSLTDKSLVVAEERVGSVRYHLLETVRQYGVEKLGGAGETTRVRSRHLAWFLEWTEEALARPSDAVNPVQWFDYMDAEHDNLRGALEYALQSADSGDTTSADRAIRFAVTLSPFWRLRSLIGEAHDYLERALARQKPGDRSLIRARALHEAGTYSRGDRSLARRRHAEAWDIFVEAGDKGAAGWVKMHLGTLARDEGELEAARRHYEEGLALFRALGDRWGAHFALAWLGLVDGAAGDYAAAQERLQESHLLGERGSHPMLYFVQGVVATYQGDYETARFTLEAFLALMRESGNRDNTAACLTWLGTIALLEDDLTTARLQFAESLNTWSNFSQTDSSQFVMHGVAALLARQSRASQAARLWGTAETIHRREGKILPPPLAEKLKPFIEQARVALGGDSFSKAMDEGSSMTGEKAVRFALEHLTPGLS